MKILLVNPNRYKSPPVPPIGLEYVASSLTDKGHAVEFVDLCFSENTSQDIDRTVRTFRPDIAGVTIRNVDTVLYHTNEFFLDEIKAVVTRLRSEHGLKVMIGGTGVSADPKGILDYLNADIAISGPAEETVHDVLDIIHDTRDSKRIFRGRYTGRGSCPRKTFRVDYKKYTDEGGIIGFETHKGCSSSCVFCLEATSRVSFKPVEHVIGEIKGFVDNGYDHFHLCDSEFNENADYAIEFCTALKKAGIGIRWAVYMKPADFNKPLFRLMKETGVYLITLSMDSWKKCDLYWSDYEKFVFGAKSFGMNVAVDFLAGFPYETDDNLLEHFNTLRRPLPDSVGVNTYIRLYKKLQITRIIQKDRSLKAHLSGNTPGANLITPFFYNHVTTEKLSSLIDGDPLFRIEGMEKGVNYSRIAC
jgi:radical SAM superfamily enzyme YgiQ (UPF0313 family)